MRQKEKERIGRFTVDFFDYCALAIFTIIDAVKVVAEKKRRKKNWIAEPKGVLLRDERATYIYTLLLLCDCHVEDSPKGARWTPTLPSPTQKKQERHWKTKKQKNKKTIINKNEKIMVIISLFGWKSSRMRSDQPHRIVRAAKWVEMYPQKWILDEV